MRLVSLRVQRLLAVLAIVVLAGCATAEEAGPIRLQANAVGGGQVYVADLADQDTVLWFWAPW